MGGWCLHPSVIISLSALVSLHCLLYTKDKMLTPQWRIKEKNLWGGKLQGEFGVREDEEEEEEG